MEQISFTFSQRHAQYVGVVPSPEEVGLGTVAQQLEIRLNRGRIMEVSQTLGLWLRLIVDAIRFNSLCCTVKN